MAGRVPLKILFVNTHHAGGVVVDAVTHSWEHVAFYDVFKSEEGVGCVVEAVLPEVGAHPITKYDEYPEKEIITLWVTRRQHQKVEKLLAAILEDPPKYGIFDCITAGIETIFDIEFGDINPRSTCCSQFVVTGLREIFELFGEKPANTITPLRLYGALKVKAHEIAQRRRAVPC